MLSCNLVVVLGGLACMDTSQENAKKAVSILSGIIGVASEENLKLIEALGEWTKDLDALIPDETLLEVDSESDVSDYLRPTTPQGRVKALAQATPMMKTRRKQRHRSRQSTQKPTPASLSLNASTLQLREHDTLQMGTGTSISCDRTCH